ncbi:hypothetical protein NX059_006436 [Plenodomus lindquistii]|nr:hypothetical protein NX059_006436 [Plenodomus lindquistii]
MSTELGPRGLANQRRARQSRGQRVYISGIRGQQSLETGVAYYYRGHHIYSATAANPIDTIPFSTRRGISVVGIAQHLAPLYVPQAADLVPESTIGALDRARKNAWADQEAQEEALKAETAIALQEEAEKKKRSKKGDIPTIGTVTTAAATNPPALVFDSAFTPHDRAQYLAASAPGSRLVSITNTPHGSRPVSPFHHDSSSSNNRCLLRPIASTSRLPQMLASRDTVGQRFSPLSDVAEGRAHHSSRTAEHSTVLDTELVANALTEWMGSHNANTRPTSSSAPRPRSSGYDAQKSSSPAARMEEEDDDEHEGISLQALGRRSAREHTPRTHSTEQTFDSTIRRPSQADLAASSSNIRPFNPPTAPAALRALGNHTASGPAAAFSSAAASRAHSPFPAFKPSTGTSSSTPLYLPGLGQTTTQHVPVAAPSTTTHRRRSSLARPQAASLALNTAYNARRATPTIEEPTGIQGLTLQGTTEQATNTFKRKCTLHGEDCDGETVTHLHHTEQCRRDRGFAEAYPMITVGGRTMIDWAKIMSEEKAKMGL